MSDNKVTAFLGKNPKMTGVLFTILLILSTGEASAAFGNTIAGP
ncbi:hypothetical protein ACFPYI_00020 [Halomarina salina]|uniref:Uncharacterized protein n=1 Tax=Halomarina salina TaxID=1872699 RepID=A0ABD5RGY6_9EURY|nr:hypothetical protein [Halomarina salina]